MTEEIYVAGVREVESLIGHSNGKSLLDLGCGAGAFVGALERSNFNFITGVDGSPSLVSVASGLATFNRVLHHRFTEESSEFEKLLGSHDYVVAISVLQYLGHNSGLELIRSAFRLSREKVMFFDIPDINNRAQAERLRSLMHGAAPPPPHTYYSRSDILAVSEEEAVRGPWNVSFLDAVFDTPQSNLRLNFVATRVEVG